MTAVLVINAGSSTVKWKLFHSGNEVRRGIHEHLKSSSGDAPHHRSAIESILADVTHENLVAVGHRVVHGGDYFKKATLVDEEVEERIDRLSPLVPLHNPVNLMGIRASREAFPSVPNVAVFDTSFHSALPPASTTYALDTEVARRFGIRRFGFHGISYQYAATEAARFLGKPLSELKLIAFHLGNGASVCAIAGGRPVETSMGMTPLEGLVMGSRSGDIDPGAILHLLREGLKPEQLDKLLSEQSGLLGLAGSEDLREVQAAATGGDLTAQAALDVYQHRLRHYLGAYLAQLGGADVILFTAGVGENSPSIRAATLRGLEDLGIQIDSDLNAAPGNQTRVISSTESRVTVMVLPANEELEIARQTVELVGHVQNRSHPGGSD